MTNCADEKARELYDAINIAGPVDQWTIDFIAQALREAYERGATEMREAAARKAAPKHRPRKNLGNGERHKIAERASKQAHVLRTEIAAAIRALITQEPVER